MRLRLSSLAGLALAISTSACTSTHYDPLPPARASTTAIASPLSMEQSYRRLYERLRACLSGPYHVHPRYDRAAGEAKIMVVAGLGLDRYSVIGNRFVARFDIRPADSGAHVDVIRADDSLAGVVAAVPGWLQDDVTGCRPPAPSAPGRL